MALPGLFSLSSLYDTQLRHTSRELPTCNSKKKYKENPFFFRIKERQKSVCLYLSLRHYREPQPRPTALRRFLFLCRFFFSFCKYKCALRQRRDWIGTWCMAKKLRFFIYISDRRICNCLELLHPQKLEARFFCKMGFSLSQNRTPWKKKNKAAFFRDICNPRNWMSVRVFFPRMQ